MSMMLEAFQGVSAPRDGIFEHQVQSPHRSTIQSPGHSTLFMPSRLPLSGTAIKVVAVPKAKGDRGLPASVLLMNETSGALHAVLNAIDLTAFRTAAGSALATHLLRGERQPPKRVVFYGGGLQVAYHARMLLHEDLYGGFVESVTVVNRSNNVRFDRVTEMIKGYVPSGASVQILISSDKTHEVDIRVAVQSADLIGCTATSSRVPLFPADWIKDGAHVNLVGSYTPDMQEVSEELISKADLILVDSLEACQSEAGELIRAGWDTIKDKVTEIGAFSRDEEKRKKISSHAITIFKSVGLGIQDVAMATLVVKIADQCRAGTSIPFD